MSRFLTGLFAACSLAFFTGASVRILALPSIMPDTTMAFREHGVRMTTGALTQATTRKLTARWSIATNVLGDATSYRVRWITRTVTGDPRTTERLVTTLSDTMTVVEPLRPDSVIVRVTVWARRRGLESVDSVWAVRSFGRADAPPPPPGPVVIDTGLVVVDSVAVLLSRSNISAGAPFGGDTVVACAYGRANNRWFRATPAGHIRATALGTTLSGTTVQLALTPRPMPAATYCPTPTFALATDSLLPVTWVPLPTVQVPASGGGNGGGRGFGARIDQRGITPVLRATED